MIRRYHISSADELIQLGKRFGVTLGDGDVVALYGDLGAGKTTFTKGIALALGITEEITSPTFNIVSLYLGKLHLIHIDAYRLNGEESINIFEYVRGPYVVVIEWPQQLPELQQKISRIVRISIDNSAERDVEIEEIER